MVPIFPISTAALRRDRGQEAALAEDRDGFEPNRDIVGTPILPVEKLRHRVFSGERP
jgi:hypothetical protein